MDLTDSRANDRFFAEACPTDVIDAAARVGEIHAKRSFPGNFLKENLAIQFNLVVRAHRHGGEKFFSWFALHLPEER